HGQLGAGKTTFIAALCHALGAIDQLSSPTFSIINEYRLRGSEEHYLYHLDLYRINDEDEAIQAGIEDCLLSSSVCFVEWPEKIPNLLPEGTVHIYLTVEENGRRLRTIPPGAEEG